MKTFLLLAAALIFASGCSSFIPQRGGRSAVSVGPVSAAVEQSENPKEASRLATESETIYQIDPGTGKTNVIVVKATTDTVIGGAQKDMSREVAAKLRSMRPVQMMGVLLILAALAMFHPAVRAITMSRTLQMVTGATGMFLIFAPAIVVGNEKILLVAGIALPVAYFFAHRHGKLQALAGDNK